MRQWVRTPKHILRKKCIEHISKNWTPDSFIEIGAGAGDITKLFLQRGFKGFCYDIGEKTREILKANLKTFGEKVKVIDSLKTLPFESVEYLFAFEVLEHIPNDYEALQSWSLFLRKGGKILISVPAHMSKYSPQDESFGHLRRYEKNGLYLLLKKTGYKNVSIINYGYPLGNITRRIADMFHIYDVNYQSLSLKERSIRSGIERAELAYRLSFLFNEWTLIPFIIIQRFFFDLDAGDGYVAMGEKI
ncbi:MAG: class I SAM-dependent methyltransferase [Candidatus Omnitrophica bacterium]|nr:class I SAM-dependent methyltransferase [Candidatus Omnitrophota bacterium]